MLGSLGRYEMLSPIASGGMASVHLGRALGAGGFERLVAIKVMHPDIAEDPAFVAMFLDEGRLAAQIRHPNVVATLDVQEGPSGLLLVMEYVEGPSLGALAKRCQQLRRRFPVAIALRIVLDVLLGLHAAHEQRGPGGTPLNLVHRDVSPQNILVTVDGLSKLTDFGVAHAEARLSTTKGGAIKGKIGYMPPQQMRGEKVDRRADVYSAAVVLWELLAGERLFQGDNEGAVLFAVLGGAQRSPCEVAKDVPAPLARVVMQGLAHDPEARPATALAFAEAIEAAAAEAAVIPASARQVATFVREAGAHKPPVLPAASPAQGAAATAASTTASTNHTPAATVLLSGRTSGRGARFAWAMAAAALGGAAAVGLARTGNHAASAVGEAAAPASTSVASAPAAAPTTSALAAPAPTASASAAPAAPPPTTTTTTAPTTTMPTTTSRPRWRPRSL